MSISIYFIKLGLLTFGAYIILLSSDDELVSLLICSGLISSGQFGLKLLYQTSYASLFPISNCLTDCFPSIASVYECLYQWALFPGQHRELDLVFKSSPAV